MAQLDPAKNFAVANVLTGYAAGATTIVLQSGLGALFPDPSTDGAFNLVYWNATDYPNPSDDASHEIVRCTARTADTLTVLRAQESTSDVDHNTVGKQYKVAMAWTKKMRDDVETYVNKQWKYLETVTFTSETGTKTTSTFASPSTAYQYKIVFYANCNGGSGTLGVTVSNTTGYGWCPRSLTAYPSSGGTTSGQGVCGLAIFGGSGESIVGEVLINAQKDNAGAISFACNASGSTAGLQVSIGGYGGMSGAGTAVENISITSAAQITGTFKIYRLDI